LNGYYPLNEAALSRAWNGGRRVILDRNVSVFDLRAMDRTADPCSNFYQFACGGWIARNPTPPDQPKWGRFDELQQRNLATLRRILEKAAASRSLRDVDTTKIGSYYASCMDEPAIEAKGRAPLDAQLEPIRAIANMADLSGVVGRLHRIGVRVMFRFRSEQDFKDATSVIAVADQGGWACPTVTST
jgi:putative endopeptidase